MTRFPDGGLIPGQNGRLTVGRQMTLTLTLTLTNSLLSDRHVTQCYSNLSDWKRSLYIYILTLRKEHGKSSQSFH
jgi:hypothetical protein